MKASSKHFVFVINLGGGPEAFIKNLEPVFLERGIRVSLLIQTNKPIPANRFSDFFKVYPFQVKPSWKSIPIFYLKNKSWLSRWAWALYKAHEENTIIQELKKIEHSQPIDLVEITEGFGMKKLHSFWKVITRAHGSDWSFRLFCQDNYNPFDAVKMRRQRFQHQHSALNFAISEHTKAHLTEALKLPEGLIQFRPYPIPLGQFNQASKAIIPHVPDDAPVILSIGRIEKRKGMHILIKAMEIVWQWNPKVRLVLLGSEAGLSIAEMKQSLAASFQDLIIHPGFVPYAEIPGYYKRATIYVSASQYETFGYTLLEAMAAGTAVISTDRGAMPELISHQQNGILVPFGEEIDLATAIQELLSNENKRSHFIQQSLEKARAYDLYTLGTQIVDDLCHA